MASQRNRTAKQSLKQRKTKMLCSRFERIRSGKRYGGACFVSFHSVSYCCRPSSLVANPFVDVYLPWPASNSPSQPLA